MIEYSFIRVNWRAGDEPMKLAVNYSQALMTLFDHDPGIPVDYIKVPTIPFPECWSQFDEGEKRRTFYWILPTPGVAPGTLGSI
jgi:hypothetical protein